MAETPRDNEEANATNPVGKIEKFISKHFIWLLVGLAVSGGALAIFGPWLLYVKGWTGETDANLRLHILYVTGGTIAVLGLIETHRKNTTDRIKADADIQNYQASQDHQAKTFNEQARQFTETIAKEREKIEADKAKNEQDHIRQVHAERRSRYSTAVEQLSNDKASIRLGGVYALVGLVDEWLADEKTIPNIEERRKEGQVIINNLCAYIRSPFLLAERAEQLDEDYTKDPQIDFDGDKEKFGADKRSFAQEKAALEEERQIRQSIIKEMREHLHNYEELAPWSYFDYDFSNAHFFYFTDFTRSRFDGSLNFTGAKFTQNTDFSGAKFTGYASFFGVEFTGYASFSGVEFTGYASFFGAKFTGYASFSEAKFTQNTDFSGVEFTGYASFSGVEFTGHANFSGVEFTGHADFFGAKFTQNADFFGAKFTQNASFSGVEFTGHANFSGAKFTGHANFSEATFQSKPIFTLDNKARFSYKINPGDHNFEASHNSPYKIETEEQEYNGVKFIIPKGTELFDPDDPSN